MMERLEFSMHEKNNQNNVTHKPIYKPQLIHVYKNSDYRRFQIIWKTCCGRYDYRNEKFNNGSIPDKRVITDIKMYILPI